MNKISSALMEQVKTVHFIGVGGSGMFPIVQILQSKGYQISGSDNNETDTLSMERKLGVQVTLGHSADNIKGADLIVYTAAIMKDNPELIAAMESGIPTVERSEILGYLTGQYPDCICVSGTHGKTSTTAMMTQILIESGLDPTAVIGGKLPLIGGNGRAGSSSIMTCEACEFVDTFLQLHPDISVILNIDADHLDYFGTLDNIIQSFRKFAQLTTRTLIVNGDDPNTMKAVKGLDKNIVTFGFEKHNHYYPSNIVQESGVKSRFDLMHKDIRLETVSLRVPGRHNVLNAVAATAAAMEVGVSPGQAADSLSRFGGAGRRFEILGEVDGITIADDYAHHPAELTVTLKTAKEMDFQSVWAVFQPFTYSRTAMLLDDFAEALSIADHVVMSEIMGSREKNTYNIYTKDLAKKISGSVWFDGFEEIADYVMARAQPGDLVITLGCGDIYKCAKMMLKK